MNDNPYSTRATNKQKRVSSTTGALLCVILFLAAILVSLIVISVRNRAEMPQAPLNPDAPLDPSITLPAVTPNVDVLTETYDMAFIGPPAPITEPDSVTVMKDNTEIHTGDLILINRNYPFNFDFEQPQTTLYSNKNRVYQLSTISLSLNSDLVPVFDTLLADFAQATGCKKVLVTSGFRSYQVQKDLYDSRVKSQGQEMADLYVALPGNSEHHAGLAIDMVIFTDGRQYYFPEYEDAAWLIEHAPDYGFILRYTEKMQEITGCASEPWHYRYVGAPHARLITEMDISFEEYHQYLQTFTWNTDRLLILEDGTTDVTDGFRLPEAGHMIYYVPAAEGDVTYIPVPPDLNYEISGDNASGFIVTVELG